MSLINKHIYALLFLAMLLPSCQQPDLVISTKPLITIEELSPLSAKEFTDEIKMTIVYEDVNGDIGDYDPNVKSLWIKDSRLDEADTYHVPPITMPGDEVAVWGKFEVELGTLFLLSNDSTEQLHYKVSLQDRAGNWSESIISPTITLSK